MRMSMHKIISTVKDAREGHSKGHLKVVVLTGSLLVKHLHETTINRSGPFEIFSM